MQRTLILFTGLVLVACGPRYRKEVVGAGSAQVGASAAAAAPGGGAVAISEPGLHRFDLAIAMPRAMRIRYQLICPEVDQTGVVGETFEQYRARRLAELEREREQTKQTVGAVTGAVLGRVEGNAAVETPNAGASVDAEVDGEAVGEAAADSALAPVELPPSDTGARTIKETLTFHVDGNGACQLALTPAEGSDTIAGASGQFTVTRLIDLEAEKRARRHAANQQGIEIRGQLTAGLVARGADPELRARQRAEAEAERARIRAERRAEKARRDAARARAHAAREAERRAAREEKMRLEWERNREVKLRLRAAVEARGRVIAWLTECGGDPYLRERLALEAEQRRTQRHRMALELRARLRADLIGLGADPEFRRKQIAAEMRAFEERAAAQREARREAQIRLAAETQAALETRASLKLALQAGGAVDRPPMPAPQVEARPAIPFDGAVWVDGSWSWNGGSWVWMSGHWAEPPRRGVIWVAPAQISIGGTVVIRPGGWVDKDSGKRVRTRDHRKRRR